MTHSVYVSYIYVHKYTNWKYFYYFGLKYDRCRFIKIKSNNLAQVLERHVNVTLKITATV